MSSQTSFENGTLTVTRTYNAPRTAVFSAWIETSMTEKWWGCDDTTHVKSEIEPKVGGKYSHIMTLHGAKHPGGGILVAYDPPKLLAFETDSPIPEVKSTVHVEFIDKGSKTMVILTHDNLLDELVQYVDPGWRAAFRKLGRVIAAFA